MDEGNDDVCQRCARTGRPCVFTPLQKRKQRKRTDTRVAELEREMRAMRAMLKNKEQANRSGSPEQSGPTARPSGVWYEENSLKAGLRDEAAVSQMGTGNARQISDDDVQSLPSGPSLWPQYIKNRPPSDSKDVVDRGVISMATARQLFETYRRELFPHYPMVAIPESTSADEMRQTKPTLFLAIIAAASGTDNADISSRLDQEILHSYATRSLVHSEKSLELVQALLVSAVWYHPPSKFGQLKYYEYIHMAATMAMDIGIGSRPSSHRSRFGNHFPGQAGERGSRKVGLHHLEDASNPDLSMTPRSRDNSPDTASLESRRTFLACYIICAGVSLSLRRPNMLRVSSYIRECVEYLELSPSALPTDRTAVAWAKLMVIAEEISLSFSYDDPGGIASIVELRTQLMLKDFERKLSVWFTNVPETDMNSSLTIMYYTIRLYLHEIALHVEHSPEDFKAPYQMGILYSWNGDEIPTQILAETVAECISCSHNLLNTFLAINPEASRALPVFSYVRVSFAAFVLAKLNLSAASPKSRIGKVLDRSSLKVENLMDRAILHVRNVVGPARCRVPAIFLALLFKLRQWCMNPEMIERADEDHNPTLLATAQSASAEQTQRFRSVMSLEAPRGVDQSSSGDEGSSQNASDAHAAAKEGTSEVTVHFELTPQSQPLDYDSASVVTTGVAETDAFATGGADMGASTTSAASISMPQTTPYLNPNDQMELDQNFFQMFGDMDGLAGGGLTGLDDWASIATDFTGLPSNFNWQTSAAFDETTTAL